MEKILEKGTAYPVEEVKRVMKILEGKVHMGSLDTSAKTQCWEMLRYCMALYGSFACYESWFLGIIVSLCHFNIQEAPETVTLKCCK